MSDCQYKDEEVIDLMSDKPLTNKDKDKKMSEISDKKYNLTNKMRVQVINYIRNNPNCSFNDIIKTLEKIEKQEEKIQALIDMLIVNGDIIENPSNHYQVLE